MKKIKLDQLSIYKHQRKTWAINPKTRVKNSSKLYNRQLNKKQLERIIREEDF